MSVGTALNPVNESTNTESKKQLGRVLNFQEQSAMDCLKNTVSDQFNKQILSGGNPAPLFTAKRQSMGGKSSQTQHSINERAIKNRQIMLKKNKELK
jgi:hypothetical protein